jgi:hypothetical protein
LDIWTSVGQEKARQDLLFLITIVLILSNYVGTIFSAGSASSQGGNLDPFLQS